LSEQTKFPTLKIRCDKQLKCISITTQCWEHKLDKRFSLFIVLLLILAVILSSFSTLNVVYQDLPDEESQNDSEPTQHEPTKPEPTEPAEPTPKILWQSDMERFATDFVVAEGKVFTTDAHGDVCCFDANSGESLWNVSIGGYNTATSTVEVYNDKLYVGCRGSVVKRLNINTGEVELSYQAPIDTSYAHKTAPSFFVADGKVFTEQNGIAVYNESNGELFWKTNMMGVLESTNISTEESDFIFIRGHYRINLNNGSVIWHISGVSSGATNVIQGKVLFWNYNSTGNVEEGETLLCVNATSGEEEWSFDVGTRMFQPTVSNGVVLFGAENGYVYALDYSDGSMNWKTFVDEQHQIAMFKNHLEIEQYRLGMAASSIKVDPLKKRVFWSIIVSRWGTNLYNATIFSLDLSDGELNWKIPVTQISPNDSRSTFSSICFSNNYLYVKEQSDLYCIEADNAEIKLSQGFEHYMFTPLLANQRVFVVADLWLIAYE
jgi:outer membrane protein assembly factor BamB